MDFNAASKCLKAMGHPDRLRIIHLLVEEETWVSFLAKKLNIAQPKVSEHLKKLEAQDLLHARREGHKVIYSIKHMNLMLSLTQCIREKYAP